MKKNLKYKNYFNNLEQILKKLNNKFLFYIPDLYKTDFRNEYIPFNIKKKFLLKKLFNKNYLYDDIKKVKKAQICFISHYIGNEIKDKDYDFYYGSLFKNLKIKLPFYVLMINHTEESLAEIQKKFKKSKINRVYINSNFNLFYDFFKLLQIIKEYFFFSITSFNKFKVLNRIKLNFNLKFFLKSRFTYKISNQIINVLDKSKNLNYLMTTFEGNAFERIIFNYCKKKNIKSFAYFFSVIREYKNNIYYSLAKNYEPDMIFTFSNVAKKDLLYNSPHTKIKILGSNKNSLKEYKFNLLKKKNKKKTTILVCPEGVLTETNKILELINKEIFNNSKFQFIFRIHPVLDFFKYSKKNQINKNIIFSKERNIKNDFKKSDIILYSGSSVCIQAIKHGLVPIYFRDKNYDFSLDPLYKINKIIVYDAVHLKSKINYILKNRFNDSFNFEIDKIKSYSNDYFQELNQDVLIDSLNINHKGNIKSNIKVR
jgi:hypothetical protein